MMALSPLVKKHNHTQASDPEARIDANAVGAVNKDIYLVRELYLSRLVG